MVKFSSQNNNIDDIKELINKEIPKKQIAIKEQQKIFNENPNVKENGLYLIKKSTLYVLIGFLIGMFLIVNISFKAGLKNEK